MEIIDIVDELGRPTGQSVDRKIAHRDGLPHRTAHVWILREKDGRVETLLQKRSLEKESFPGQYDTSSAGHVSAGDEPLESALRELEEELGIRADAEQLTFAGTFRIRYSSVFHDAPFHDNEVAFVYLYREPVDESALVLQASEVDSVAWFPLEEIAAARAGNDQRFCVPRDGLAMVRRLTDPTFTQSLIDRNHVIEAFRAYASDYDITNGKVSLKIDHTYRVAAFCDRIADSLGLTGDDRDLAWLLGMLHDIGRFEQVRRFDSFVDRDTVDHAKFGADLLFGPEPGSERLTPEEMSAGPLIGTFVHGFASHPDGRLAELAIRVHNDYRLPEGLSDRERMFCQILRDADKLDIFRVNLDSSPEVIYNCAPGAWNLDPVTEEVMDCVRRETCVLRAIKKVPVDHIVGHICLAFELIYPASLQIAREQGYLDQLMHFPVTNPVSQEQFREIRERMASYMERRLGI